MSESIVFGIIPNVRIKMQPNAILSIYKVKCPDSEHLEKIKTLKTKI